MLYVWIISAQSRCRRGAIDNGPSCVATSGSLHHCRDRASSQRQSTRDTDGRSSRLTSSGLGNNTSSIGFYFLVGAALDSPMRVCSRQLSLRIYVFWDARGGPLPPRARAPRHPIELVLGRGGYAPGNTSFVRR